MTPTRQPLPVTKDKPAVSGGTQLPPKAQAHVAAAAGGTQLPPKAVAHSGR
jgi:hypothetical protein